MGAIPRGVRPYLNDGQNLRLGARIPASPGASPRRRHGSSSRLIPPLVIVGIDHGELLRAREYLPVEDDRNPYARPARPQYASFVTTELMPFIEREYPVAHGASCTGSGSSYGAGRPSRQ
jgi:hypothetical protein